MYKLSISLLVSLLLCAVETVCADVVSLTTSKATGETLTLCMTAAISADLEWGTGDTETLKFSGEPQSVVVKDSVLSITTNRPTLLLYIPSSGLTSLDCSGATSLKVLICPDNELTSLDLSACTALEELDCSNNELTSLTIGYCEALLRLNCANNQLSGMAYTQTTAAQLTSIVCGGNNLSSLRYYNKLTALQTLWAEENDFSSLVLRTSHDLRSLNLSGNGMTSLTLGSNEYLHDLWLRDNSLQSLDLSPGTPALELVDVTANGMDTIIWDTSCEETLNYFYAADNDLFFNSFPTPTNIIDAIYEPQSAYYLLDHAALATRVDLGDYLSYDGFGNSYSRTYTLVNAEGDTLVANAADDYMVVSNTRFFFSTAQSGVTMYVYSPDYDVTLASQPFDTGETTGIAAVESETAGDGIYYDLQGRRVLKPEHGIYIINGRKVVFD